MQKKQKTEVIFRVFKEGNVLAMLPYEKYDRRGEFCNSYQHIGQHGAADYVGCMRETRPAKPEEYNELFQELTSIGYDLKIIKRASYKRMFDAIWKK